MVLRLWEIDFFGWSSEIHRTGIGGVEQREGFEEKKEEPFPPTLVLFPSLIIVFSQHCTRRFLFLAWTSESLNQRLRKLKTLDLSNYSTFYTSNLNCTTGSRELRPYYSEIKASLIAHILDTLFRESLVIICFLLLSPITLHCPRSLYVGITLTPFLTCYAHAHFSRCSLS